jgi:hypothetical protein
VLLEEAHLFRKGRRPVADVAVRSARRPQFIEVSIALASLVGGTGPAAHRFALCILHLDSESGDGRAEQYQGRGNKVGQTHVNILALNNGSGSGQFATMAFG